MPAAKSLDAEFLSELLKWKDQAFGDGGKKECE